LTRQHGVLLIFDEVVTGFPVSPGGAQAEYGIRPDLTTLAKILAGGLPGGAVVGRKDILDLLDFQVTRAADREKITHQGTFNANPLSAAAGVAALEIVGTTDACAVANRYADTMRRRINEVFEEERWRRRPTACFPTSTSLRTRAAAPLCPTRFDPQEQPAEALLRQESGRSRAQIPAGDDVGVDFSGSRGGVTSATHGKAELEDTVKAVRNAVRMLRQEGEV
jgi:glutamate-1-semialdehyde 2,1-aminomutase